MRRIERRLLRIGDELERLRREEQLVEGELNMHRHLADDAARDVAVYEGLDRAESRMANKDVAGLERALERTRRQLRRVESKREDLLRRLDASR